MTFAPASDDRQILLRYRRDVYSQCGEDGILECVRSFLPAIDGPRRCVEAGAGDGLQNSNTAFLVAQGWHALWVEADPAKAAACQANAANLADRVRVVPARVGYLPDDPHRLDALLADWLGHPAGVRVDLLVLDIDGNEAHVWAGLRHFAPLLVLVEHNPTLPPWLPLVPPADPMGRRGASLGGLAAVAQSIPPPIMAGFDGPRTQHAYDLLAATEYNALFSRSDLHLPDAIGLESDRGLSPLEAYLAWPYLTVVGQDYVGDQLRVVGNVARVWGPTGRSIVPQPAAGPILQPYGMM